MPQKADDSSLDPSDRRFVEARAKRLLDRANAWGRFPTQVDDIMEAAELKVASCSIFDPAAIIAFVQSKGTQAASSVKSALSKILGLYDGQENIVHIDETVTASKQTFLKLHEVGHHELPAHRRMFRFFEESEETLNSEIADQFEREANNFARFVLFQGGTYGELAANEAFEIKSAIKLAKVFGASIYASVREYVRTNKRTCLAYVLEPVEFLSPINFQAQVRRIEASPTFILRFGLPIETVITANHSLAELLPIGRKMTRPTSFRITDRNGDKHEMIGEAFSTPYNVLILITAVKELPGPVEHSGLILPA